MAELTLTVQGQTLSFGVLIAETGQIANVGAGEGVFRDKVADTFNLKSITGTGGIVVSSGPDEVNIDSTAAGDVSGPASGTDDAVARFNGATGKVIQDSLVTVDDAGNIATPGTVDGRDVSIDGVKLDTVETGAVALPVDDATAIAKGSVDATKLVRIEADGLTAGTTRVLTMPDADITPDDASAPRTPLAHETAHRSGGSDELSHDDLADVAIAQHRIINDSGFSTIELWSASKIDSELSTLIDGLDLKAGVDTSTTGLGNITLSGEQTLNGLLTSTSDVVVTEQTLPEENGLYVSAAGAWSRRADADTDPEVTNGNVVHVVNTGSTKFTFKYLLVSPDPIVVGTDAQTWEEHKDIDFGTTAGTATEGNDSRVPAQDENDALVGTDGTASAANPYVTDSDPRNSDTRTPTAHASAHEDGGGDEINVLGLSGLLADDQNALALRETAGPTLLTLAGIADGQFLKRSGATVIGDVGNLVQTVSTDLLVDVTTVSGVFVNLLTSAITITAGNKLVVGMTLGLSPDSNNMGASIQIRVLGGISRAVNVPLRTANVGSNAGIILVATGLSGAQTIQLRWRISSGAGTLRCRAATAQGSEHAILHLSEVKV